MAKWYLNESGELWRLHDDINEVKKELQEVAELLGLPVEHEQVFIKWQYRGNNTTDEIHEKYIVPIYFPISIIDGKWIDTRTGKEWHFNKKD